jgi:thiol-disulfide isomerase/thioredoxin
MKKILLVTLFMLISLSFGALAMGNMPKLLPEKDSDQTLASPFALNDLNGNRVSLVGQRGKVVLLNFWASWCPPCRGEMPSMQKLHEKMLGKKFIILAVSLDRSFETAKTFAGKNGYTFPILLDTSGSVAKEYGISGIPTTYILDKNGNILSKEIGGRDWASADVINRLNDLINK